MSPDDLYFGDITPHSNVTEPVMTAVVASAHQSDGLYIAAAASICGVDIIVTETVAETIDGLSGVTSPILFMDVELAGHEILTAYFQSRKSDPELDPIPIVSIISKDETDDRQAPMSTAKPPGGVSAVLLRPLPIADVVRIMKLYQASIPQDFLSDS